MDRKLDSSLSSRERIQGVFDQLESIKSICRVPSISVGIIHEGKVLFQGSVGLRDVEEEQPADENTVYMLGSCSKMFLAAAVGILVDKGVMSWDDPIQKHVPDFNPLGDPEIGERATIRNALSHTTGLGRPQTVAWGPNGCAVVDESSFVQLLNHAQTEDQEGPRFRRKQYYYSNQAYAVVALAVQNVSGSRYSDFLEENIFKPLGMHDTVAGDRGIEACHNKAHGYAKLQDGSFTKIDTSSWTDDKNSPNLAPAGIRSSVKDMLIWLTALLDSQRNEGAGNRAIRELSSIWKAQADIGPDLAYCLGWYRGHLPSPGFGGISINYRTFSHDPDSYLEKYVIGRESPRKTFIGHSGNIAGFACSTYVFPETSSAVVAMANGLDLGDAADFAVKLFTQALLDSKPAVDIVELAKQEATHHERFFEGMLLDWLKFRDVGPREPDIENFVGTYEGFSIRINVFIREETGRLAFNFNSLEKSECDLEFYCKDDEFEIYSFMPLKRDEWLSRGMMDWDNYAVGLFYFTRDEDTGEVDALCWLYEPVEPMAWFMKSN
ncbi:hypothetical protein ANO14919_001020 [Xylariales sp. No.14919]|nr:hypothetical protein ANO14919_001020 [Xylariales sp. No.14919]